MVHTSLAEREMERAERVRFWRQGRTVAKAAAREAVHTAVERATDIAERRLAAPKEGAPLTWKTSRGPMAVRPPPRRRRPTAQHGVIRAGVAPAKGVPSPSAKPPPTLVLYAAPLERARPPREDAQEQPRRSARFVHARDTADHRRRQPRTRRLPVTEAVEAAEAALESALGDAESRQEEQVRAVDYEAEDRYELSPTLEDTRALRRPAATPDETEELILRGRRAYRRLMAGESRSAKDIYKTMLELAWRHRLDKVPPPLPHAPPVTRGPRAPLDLHGPRHKARPLPPRPPRRPSLLDSEEALHTGRVGGRLRAAAAVEARPSTLLDPASWAPAGGRRIADPRAPPLPGRVPRGWINVLDIGVAA